MTMKEYDINEAARYIKSALDRAGITQITDAEIEQLTDLIWDGYDELGFLDDIDIADDGDEAAKHEQMIGFLMENTEGLAREVIEIVLKAETDYEDSLL